MEDWEVVEGVLVLSVEWGVGVVFGGGFVVTWTTKKELDMYEESHLILHAH